MNISALTPILNVSSVPASLRWFENFGFRRGFTWNSDGMIPGAADSTPTGGPAEFASVCAGKGESGVQIFLCNGAQGVRLDTGGKPPRFDGNDDCGAVWMSLWVGSPAEVDEAHALALKHGVTVLWPPTDEPWGVRECRIMHPDGHVFRISAGLTGS